MAEYIEREAVYEKAYWHGEHPDVGNPFPDGVDAIDIKDVDAIPAADVAPVRHGRWEWFEEWNPSTPDHPIECEDYGWRCSECKTALEDLVYGIFDDPDEELKLNYCPNCGARMDLEE